MKAHNVNIPQPYEDNHSYNDELLHSFVLNHDRLRTGVWKDLPPDIYELFDKLGIRIDVELFLHVSERDESLVAYSPPGDYGRYVLDRQVATRIGKFLTNLGYGQHAPKVSSAYSRHVYTPTLKIATSASDIRWVYMHGPSSCMSKPVHNYEPYLENENIHPVEVYAGSGDLGVAYILNKSGRVSARTVVNLRDQSYVRIYGDEEALSEILSHHGYQRRYGALAGCRMTLIEIDDERVVAPYLDGDCQYADIRDGWLVISDEGEFSCNGTEGLGIATIQCDCCGEYYSRSSMTETESDGLVCSGCLDAYYVYALNEYGDSLVVHVDNAIYSSSEGDYYTEDAYSEKFCRDYNGDEQLIEDCVTCYFTDEYVLADDTIGVRMPDGDEVRAIPDDDKFVWSDEAGAYLIKDEASNDWHYPQGE